MLPGPAVVLCSGPDGTTALSGPEVEALGRQLDTAIKYAFTVRDWGTSRLLLDFAIAVNRAAVGSAGSVQVPCSAASAEPRNTGEAPDAGLSGQPAVTLSTQEAANALGVSDSYVRRLVRERTLEVRDSQGPGYEIYARSVAAWQERRRRKETDGKAA